MCPFRDTCYIVIIHASGPQKQIQTPQEPSGHLPAKILDPWPTLPVSGRKLVKSGRHLGKINTCRLQKIITSRKIVRNLELIASPSTQADSIGTYFSSWTRSRPLLIFWNQKSASYPNFDLWENFQESQTVFPTNVDEDSRTVSLINH